MINTTLALPQFCRFKNKIYGNDILGFSYIFIPQSSGGSRIFRWIAKQEGAHQRFIWQFFVKMCMKMKEIGPRGGCAPHPRHGSTATIKYVDLRSVL